MNPGGCRPVRPLPGINNNELSNNEKSAIITRLHNTNDDLSINSEEPVINQYKIEHQTSTDSFQGTFQESERKISRIHPTQVCSVLRVF